ncbi:redox-sensitive transcriptional activator SoxR [Acidisoma cellulosilytica]|uniref:Redox-sensitive transcriptional activator SoxR n=1 Tax=Acidisoma cellulosilyticum TaxID=2802395 RepID=A0A963YYH9_9PROT|nr:redox-sensitive transcriptional activator SoxR [Acidisoma cellulosilyticum]
MTVGAVASRTGLAVSAIHFYERRGLIRSLRTAGNQRRYDREVLRRLALIQVAQELGIGLAEVQAVFATLPDGRTPTRKDWEAISRGWAADLDRRIALMQRLRDDLDGCIGCGCLSLDRCAIFNGEDILASSGQGAVRLRRAAKRRA